VSARTFLVLSVLAGALLLPASAFAEGGWGGFQPGDLNSNIQSSMQAAMVSQSGTATSGGAIATGGTAVGGTGGSASGGYANSGAIGGDQVNASEAGRAEASSGSISGGNTTSAGNKGGSATTKDQKPTLPIVPMARLMARRIQD